MVTAAEQNLQAPSSTITADEIANAPPALFDVSEIIPHAQEVNLTGNSTNGQRGEKQPPD